jgi:hypothetical protein
VRLLLDYGRQRLVRRPVLAAILLVTAGAQIGRGLSSDAAVASDLVISLCLVASFRIWDDVMDRERDGLAHPERVVVRATSIAPLAIASSSVALAGAIVLLRGPGAGSVLLMIAFAGVLVVWYAVRQARSAAGDRLLLLKYPIFTLALIGPAPLTPRAAASALGVYLAACIYEWRHDRQSPVFSFGGSR